MKRARVMFINCPTLSVASASYLVLSQNKAQKSVEFEVVHHWIYGTHVPTTQGLLEKFVFWLSEKLPHSALLDRWARTKLDLRAAPYFANRLTHNGWFDTARKAIDNYDKWFAASSYNKFDAQPEPTIIITETPFEGGYLGASKENTAIISLAEWKTFFKPGSALEYVLTSVQRYALRLLYKNIGSHYPTRGCIWDFDVHQPDSRIAAYMGILCSTCRGNLAGVMSPAELDEVEMLLANEWIGSAEAQNSVSSSLRKIFGYPLRRSTGLHPTMFESLAQGMRTELGKFLLDITKVVLAALATLYIASKFPEAYKVISSK